MSIADTRPRVNGGAEALARYLREHPESAHLPAEEVARETGLEPDFVADVLESLKGPNLEKPIVKARTPRQVIGSGIYRLRLLFRAMTQKPLLFVFVTLALALTAFSIFLPAARGGPAEPVGRPMILQTWQTAILIGVGILHLLNYYRHGMVRYALLGGLIVWLTIASINMILAWSANQNLPDTVVIGKLMVIAVKSMLLAAQYTLVAVGAAVLGGLVRIRQSETQAQRLSRHELLQRLFAIRERLRKADPIRDETLHARRQKAAEIYRMSWPIWCALLGIAFSALYMAVLTWLGATETLGDSSPMVAVASAVFFLLELLLVAVIGFLSEHIWSALVGAWIYQAASLLPLMTPVQGFGVDMVAKTYSMPGVWITLVAFTTGVALISNLGGRIEARVLSERRLKENDPAALVAEMVRIEWQLSPTPSDISVMSVDAARSSEMKSASDPFDVEYSFREYLQLIRKISESFGGHIHSTAGDGAVVIFPDAHRAFMAARRIQTDIDQFNREVNRLKLPFRLRVGLHRGTVAGEVEQVQFSEVLDIAAHVQNVAPVGGIALTEKVVGMLENERLAPLQDPVDGQKVFVALDPTLD